MAGENRPMTSKQAKASFKKRGRVTAPVSDKARRQLERAAELSNRAAQLREKEKRKKQNALLREKREAKQKEQRIAQGLPALPEPKVKASQPQIQGFFANYKERKTAAEARNREREDGEAREGMNAESSGYSESEACDDLDDQTSDDLQDHDANQRDSQQERVFVKKIPVSRKRTHNESIAPPSTVPARRARDVTDPLVQTNVKEIWVPPSQDTIKQRRHRSAQSPRHSGSSKFWKIPWNPAIFGQSRFNDHQSHDVNLSEVSLRNCAPENVARSSSRSAQGLPESAQHTMCMIGDQQSEHSAIDNVQAPFVSRTPGSQKTLVSRTAMQSHHGQQETPQQQDTEATSNLSHRATPPTTKVPQRSQRFASPTTHIEDLAHFFPNDSQVLVEDATSKISNDGHDLDFAALLPNDSQALASSVSSMQSQARADPPQPATRDAVEQSGPVIDADSFYQDITSSQLVELDGFPDEAHNYAVEDAGTHLPHAVSPVKGTMISSQDLQELVDGITSSQLLGFDEEIEKQALPALDPDIEPGPPTDVRQEVLFSDELDLNPEEAAALEATARVFPEAYEASITEHQPLQIRSFTTDYGDFEVSTQELQELPL